MSDPQPDLEAGISSHSLNSGANLLRQTSAVFTAGAGGLHHNSSQSESAARTSSQGPRPGLLRQQSSTRMRASPETDVVRDRLQEDVFAEMMQSPMLIFIIGIFFLVFFGFLFALSFFFFKALIAVVVTWGLPCDQPIKIYFIVHLLWSRLPQLFERSLVESGASTVSQACASGCSTLIGWLIIYWGYNMVNEAHSCPKTNPELYYTMKSYIYLQLWFSLFCLVAMLLACYGARRFMLLALQMSNRQVGCVKAVHNLPKVKAGDPGLYDEDGEVMGCPICMEPLSDAVRTPCGHFFHEECLATWCKSHIDCPLCRQTVGEPDDEANSPTRDPGAAGQTGGDVYRQLPSSSSQAAPSPPCPPSAMQQGASATRQAPSTSSQGAPSQSNSPAVATTQQRRQLGKHEQAPQGPPSPLRRSAASPASPSSVTTSGRQQPTQTSPEDGTLQRDLELQRSPLLAQAGPGEHQAVTSERMQRPLRKREILAERDEDEEMTEVTGDTSVTDQAAGATLMEKVEEEPLNARLRDLLSKSLEDGSLQTAISSNPLKERLRESFSKSLADGTLQAAIASQAAISSSDLKLRLEEISTSAAGGSLQAAVALQTDKGNSEKPEAEVDEAKIRVREAFMAAAANGNLKAALQEVEAVENAKIRVRESFTAAVANANLKVALQEACGSGGMTRDEKTPVTGSEQPAASQADKMKAVAKGLSDAAAAITSSHPAVADGLLHASAAIIGSSQLQHPVVLGVDGA